MKFLSYYQLERNPFGKYVEEKNIYSSEDAKEAQARIEYAVEIDGIALITGEPGTGKTTVVRKYMDELDADLYKLIYLSAGNYKVFDFYHALCDSLNIPTERCQRINMFSRIQNEFVRMQEEDRVKPIVIIDDAHMLSAKVIEEFKIFYDFDFDSRCYVSLVMMGNQGIRDMIKQIKFESLRDRIVTNYDMKGLTDDETAEYVRSRLECCGGNPEMFSRQVTNAINLAGRSNCRRINSIVTGMLMLGYAEKRTTFDVDDVKKARDEMLI